MIRDELLALLWRSADRYISGEELARSLRVSRTAVWKAMDRLRAEGYAIESVPRRGYRLRSASDVLSEKGIRRHLKHQELRLQVYKSISSTNTVLKTLAAEGAEAGLVLAASEQSAGRGRLGRSFYSPADTGLYLSLLLRPTLRAEEATRLTACAAVAAAEAIESLSGRDTQIKWVNDIFMDGRKVCGILTEAGVDCESGLLHYAIIGIGVNTRVPAGDFPAELRDIAGAAFGAEPIPELRCRLAAGILDRLADYTRKPEDPALFEAYRRRSLILGQQIWILSPGREPQAAEALDLEPDYALLVRLPDGSPERLRAGEVSVRSGDGTNRN